MFTPLLGYTQNVIPDDSTSNCLIYISGWYNTKKKVPVYQYELVKDFRGVISKKELRATQCKIKKIVISEGGFFKSMTVKLPNKKLYTIGYHNYLAVIKRFNIKDIYDDLEMGKVSLYFKDDELSLMYK